MSKRGVSKISGNPSPKVGEATTYSIDDWYSSTPQNQRNPARVTWELFKKRSNGRFTTTNIKKVGDGNFTFGEVAQKHTYRLEAYLFEPEGSGASTIEITPQPQEVPKIEKVELQYVDDSPGTVFSFTEKMRARAQCVNLNGKKLKFTLWEDDESGEGHNDKNLLIETKEATVDQTGVAVAEFMLTRALMQKAMQGEADAKQLEFYVTVEYFSHTKHATENRSVDNPLYAPVPATRPEPTPEQPVTNPTTPSTPAETPTNNTQPRAENSPAAEKPESQMEERGVSNETSTQSGELHDYQETQGTIEAEQPPTPQTNEGKTVSVVQDSSVEELLDAYFAKKEYRDPKADETKEADEKKYTYTFNNDKGTTITAENKTRLAGIIHGNIKEGKLGNAKVDEKKIIYVADVENALEVKTYAKGEKIEIVQYKRVEELKKITTAPLDTKLYLVAKTAGSGLSGKQATIIIKEKDGLIKGSADSVLSVVEITEAQMTEDTSAEGEVKGTEKSEFTGTIENGMVKIPVHLRPKSNDTLKEWKDKILKGKEDGDYTYKFGGPNNITKEEDKTRIAQIILDNAKKGNSNNTKIEDGKTANIDEIVKVLEIKSYAAGDTITFKLHKKIKELLYLNVKTTGEKEHNKDFLKADGAYFEIGGSCYCNRDISVTEFKTILKKLRESESVSNTTDLFFADNCSVNDKTVEGFVSGLNKIFKDYSINTCIRKIHFLAQIYHETDKLKTTKEYGGKDSYKPYVGRGLMQLTWESNYKLYKAYSGQDVVTDYERVAEELDLTLDTAGWYWKQGKVLSVGDRWKGPSDAPDYVKNQNPDYPKTTITYNDGTKNRSYGTVDLGIIADDDKVDLISYLVNGGANGIQERRDYVKELKKIFEYPEHCANTKAGTGNVTIRLTRKWETEISTIGEFTIDNSTISGYILEEKGPDTTVSGMEQRVPIGTYNLEWHSGTKFAKALKLSNDVVSVSRAILIHAGNTASDTEGCLLPGSSKSTDFVGGSRDKLNEIFKFVEDNGIEGAQIIITEAYE